MMLSTTQPVTSGDLSPDSQSNDPYAPNSSMRSRFHPWCEFTGALITAPLQIAQAKGFIGDPGPNNPEAKFLHALRVIVWGVPDQVWQEHGEDFCNFLKDIPIPDSDNITTKKAYFDSVRGYLAGSSTQSTNPFAKLFARYRSESCQEIDDNTWVEQFLNGVALCSQNMQGPVLSQEPLLAVFSQEFVSAVDSIMSPSASNPPGMNASRTEEQQELENQVRQQIQSFQEGLMKQMQMEPVVNPVASDASQGGAKKEEGDTSCMFQVS